MNREIKLRAWSPDNQEMYFPDETYSFRIHKTSISFAPHYDTDELTSFSTDPDDSEKKIEVMQYIGLNDKNGAEIYEGDIDQYGGVFIWVQDSCSFCIDYKGVELSPIDGDTSEWCEIVGNIYEHPNLLPHE